jgi:heat shock protein HslJ
MTVIGGVLAVSMALAGSEWGYASGGETFIQFGDGRASGSGGCNRFSGTYTQDGDRVRIGPLAATKMACLDETLMQKEQRFFEMLEAVRTVDATHMKLVLKDETGKDLAVLVRRDWD